MNNLNSLTPYNSSPNFGKTILNKVNLQKRQGDTFKLAKGYFSQLNTTDKRDLRLIKSIKPEWESKIMFSEDLIKKFEADFSKDINKCSTNLYMTELKSPISKISKKVCCLMETTNPQMNPNDREVFRINTVLSAPHIANSYPLQERDIKGAGELSIYGAVKLAQKEGYKKIQLQSVINPFFEHIGLILTEKYNKLSGIFELPQEKYADFLQKVESKYHLK